MGPAVSARYLFIALVAMMAISVFASAQTRAVHEGVLLVAHPGMADPRFAETVVLVAYPPESGPIGVVLNRPSPLKLRSLWPDRGERQGRTDSIYFGGPVQPDGLLFVFRMSPAPKDALWVTGDVYLSGDESILDKLLAIPVPAFDQRFFAGYAGWAKGQLEFEIAQRGWYVLPADPDVIFGMKPQDMWSRLIERATLPRARASQPCAGGRARIRSVAARTKPFTANRTIRNTPLTPMEEMWKISCSR